MELNSLLITGGAGFIGSEYVRQAVELDKYSKIYVIDSLTYASDLARIQKQIDKSEIEFIECDVSDTESYKKILSNSKQIVHFAAESHVDRSNVDGMPFLKSNIVGTYALLEAARTHSQIRTLLVSTDEVYGSIEEGSFLESSRLNPSSAYSASKASSDLFGLAMHRTFQQNIVISRGCNTFGPHQHTEKFIPMSITKLLKGQNVPIYGDGNQIREWIYVSDHATAIQRVLEDGKSGRVYNIGTGVRTSNLDLISIILRKLNLAGDRLDFVSDRPGHDRRYALNTERLKYEIGWKPKVDFEIGMDRTIEWYASKTLVK